MTGTIQATRAVRLALEDLAQGNARQVLDRAQKYRGELSDKVARRTLARMVRKGQVELVAGVYVNRAPRSARRPLEVIAW